MAGSPLLAIVGKEVILGAGRADLIAVERSGRVVIIEVKLATNSEARRAVVAQVLAYAAHLHGLTPEQLESGVLGRHLREREHESLFGAVLAASQEQYSDGGLQHFSARLSESLAEGRFRLVIVLDAAPEDLVRLVGYLEFVSDRLVIDLITVAAYKVGDTELVVPTRVEPERFRAEQALGGEPSADQGTETPGIDVFREAVVTGSVAQKASLEPVCQWALALERRHLASLVTYQGAAGTTLRVYIPGDMSLVIVNRGESTASIQHFKSVFEKRAPHAMGVVEEIMGIPMGQGTAHKTLGDHYLEALTAAYEEAAMGRLTT